MSRVHSKQSRILVNSTVASCDITGYTTTHRRNLADVTTVCEEGSRWLPGQLTGALSLKGLYDTAAASLYAAAAAAVGVDDRRS